MGNYQKFNYQKFNEMRTAKEIPYVIIKGFQDNIRVANPNDFTNYTLDRYKQANKIQRQAYKKIYRVARGNQQHDLLMIEKEIKKLQAKYNKILRHAYNESREIKLKDFELINNSIFGKPTRDIK